MAESTPPTPDEFEQLQRSLNEKVLDRAASDPQWKQLLLEDPTAAIREAGFPEFRRIEELRQRQAQEVEEEAEVIGQFSTGQLSGRPEDDVCTCKNIRAYTDFYTW